MKILVLQYTCTVLFQLCVVYRSSPYWKHYQKLHTELLEVSRLNHITMNFLLVLFNIIKTITINI